MNPERRQLSVINLPESTPPETRLPVVPETIVVHLGAPNQPAENVEIPFSDYIVQ